MARRRTHPLPMPPRGGGPTAAIVAREDEPVSGPQSDLCKRTRCCVCWVVWCSTKMGRRWVPDYSIKIDWRKLPVLYDDGETAVLASEPHHEPHRTQGGLDSDCIPLCGSHHRTGMFTWKARHECGTADEFFGHYGINVLEVKEEMRRRVTR